MSETRHAPKIHSSLTTGEPEAVDYLDLTFPTYEIGEEIGKLWIAHTRTLDDAARIVQAVNSHDALVKALRQIAGGLGLAYPAREDFRDIALAALAAAKGTP